MADEAEIALLLTLHPRAERLLMDANQLSKLYNEKHQHVPRVSEALQITPTKLIPLPRSLSLVVYEAK